MIRWRQIDLTEVDSTNRLLADRARGGEPVGLVVRADFQTAGRGRLDRSWEAPPRSGLLASALVPAPADRALAVAAVALAARAACVRLSGVRPDLKWPNDLVVSDHKIGGLLAELIPRDGGDVVVVGVGVNLTWPGPPEANGTSLLAESGLTIEPRSLCDLLIEELAERVEMFDDPSRLREEYVAALATIGRTVRVTTATGDLVGVARAVDHSLRLEVVGDDRATWIDVGDVVHLRGEPA